MLSSVKLNSYVLLSLMTVLCNPSLLFAPKRIFLILTRIFKIKSFWFSCHCLAGRGFIFSSQWLMFWRGYYKLFLSEEKLQISILLLYTCTLPLMMLSSFSASPPPPQHSRNEKLPQNQRRNLDYLGIV